MQQQHCVLILLFVFNHIMQTVLQSLPMSPCPKMFQYRFDGTEWFGILSVRNPDHGQPLHLRVTLSLRGKPTTDYLGEIELLTRGQYLSSAPVLYKIKFPKTNFPPKLLQITINGQIVCLGSAELSIFVTQIQLEHTRKFTFIPDGASLPPSRKAPAYQRAEATAGLHDTDDFLTSNLSFEGKHLKSLPLTRIENPSLSMKDICGTIDNRIQFQVLLATKRSAMASEFRNSAGSMLSQKTSNDNSPELDYHNDAADGNDDNINKNGASDVPLVTADILDPLTDDVGLAKMSSAAKEELPSITRGAWPWLAAIYVNNLTSLAYQCGGTLVSPRIVISSAHCFKMFQKSYTANEVLVFLGRHNLKNWNEEGSIAAPVDDIFIHPDFDGHLNTYDADIAILVLRNHVRFNTFIRPACLWSGATNTEFIEGEHGIVVGWGLSSSLKAKSSQSMPRAINAPIVSNDACFKFNKKFHSLSSNRTFCAGIVSSSISQSVVQRQQRKSKLKFINNNNNNNKKSKTEQTNSSGPCTGDSGSGLMILKNNRWVLRGIVSATIPLNEKNNNRQQHFPSTEADADAEAKADSKALGCNVNQYVIYTDVAKFLDWIFAFII